MNDHRPPFDAIVFDLDDTLLDTSTQLIPKARRQACEKMIAHGLQATLEQCQAAKTRNFEELASMFGGNSSIARVGFEAFYKRDVEKDIELSDETNTLLKRLAKTYTLHLVTAGHPETQKQKLEILKLNDKFATITIVDTFKNQKKGEAFARIPSGRNLSVGNRLDTDIAPAKKLGWSTCWIKYGEYAHTSPTTPDEIPDFTIASMNDLERTCQL